jgi:PAS domain S-box-containing protein
MPLWEPMSDTENWEAAALSTRADLAPGAHKDASVTAPPAQRPARTPALSSVAAEAERVAERERSRRSRLALLAGGMATWDIVADTGQIVADDGLATLFGLDGHTLSGNMADFVARIHPDDRAGVLDQFQTALREMQVYRCEYRVVRPDGTIRWLSAAGEPYVDETGTRRIAGFNADITERVDSARAAAEADHRAREVLDAAGDGFLLLDADWTIRFANRAACTILPEGARLLSPAPFREVFPGVVGTELEAFYARVMATGTAERIVTEYAPHGRSYEVRCFPSGPGIAISFRDVTAERARQDANITLFREMNHRVKNLFAIAISMIRLTARGAASTEVMVRDLTDRMTALAMAHDLVQPVGTEDDPSGIEPIALSRLVSVLLRPHVGEASGRLKVHGPEVIVGSTALTHLALAIHELATNAAKHGALSNTVGSLDVAWTIQGDRLALQWTERGGPPVLAPSSSGFGSQLTKVTITGQFGGTLQHDWNREGLGVTMVIPLGRLTA